MRSAILDSAVRPVADICVEREAKLMDSPSWLKIPDSRHAK